MEGAKHFVLQTRRFVEASFPTRDRERGNVQRFCQVALRQTKCFADERDLYGSHSLRLRQVLDGACAVSTDICRGVVNEAPCEIPRASGDKRPEQ